MTAQVLMISKLTATLQPLQVIHVTAHVVLISKLTAALQPLQVIHNNNIEVLYS